MKLGWYSFKDFDVQEYEYYEKVENGDLNWIIPGEVLAFMGPSGKSYDRGGMRLHTPEDYSKLFTALNVERVVRLNKAIYDKSVSFFLTLIRGSHDMVSKWMTYISSMDLPLPSTYVTTSSQ